MCNRLYDYFTVNNVLFNKQFGFRADHSTEHTFLQPIDQIGDSFNNKKYFLGIFIDLSKAFDTVYYSILLKKIELGIKERNLSLFQSYLSNFKQYIEYKQENKTCNTKLSNMICEVLQGSIQEPLIFIIYVNNSCQTLGFLKPIMFDDGTKLFRKRRTVKTLFESKYQA